MTTFNQPLDGNSMPRFGGPATMMRLSSATTAKGLDEGFTGIPKDHGTITDDKGFDMGLHQADSRNLVGPLCHKGESGFKFTRSLASEADMTAGKRHVDRWALSG